MPVIRIPTPLRSYTNGASDVPVPGGTAGEAMQNLVTEFPALKQHLYNNQDNLRPFVNLFLGADNIKDLQGLETPLEESDILFLVPAVAGG